MLEIDWIIYGVEVCVNAEDERKIVKVHFR
jgi:hypothetical protein